MSECEHKHTVHSELKGLTHFELCLDCGLSRGENEQDSSEWSYVDASQINVVRQFNKLQAKNDKQKALLNEISNNGGLMEWINTHCDDDLGDRIIEAPKGVE